MASVGTAAADGLELSEIALVEGAAAQGASPDSEKAMSEQRAKPRKMFSSGALSQISTDSSSLGEVSPYTEGEAVPRGVSWEACATLSSSTSASERGASKADFGDLPGAADHTRAPAGGFTLRAGVAEIPHPDKASYGGEDSWFLSDDGSAMGVADGVSEWGWRFGLNPRHFAQELMEGARAAAEEATAGGAQERAAAALCRGHDGVRSFGAATALVLVLDAAGGEVGIASIGDCSFRLLRPSAADHRMQVVAQTVEQMHEFGKPFQLTHTPKSSDFPRLRAEGKNALVQAVKRCHANKPDMPADAELYTFEVREGDLLVLGSDGFFDNVCDGELCRLVGEEAHHCGEATDSGRIAATLARAASARMAEPVGAPNGADAAEGAPARPPTPLAARARCAGMEIPGGVQDDITVVAAWVARA